MSPAEEGIRAARQDDRMRALGTAAFAAFNAALRAGVDRDKAETIAQAAAQAAASGDRLNAAHLAMHQAYQEAERAANAIAEAFQMGRARLVQHPAGTPDSLGIRVLAERFWLAAVALDDAADAYMEAEAEA